MGLFSQDVHLQRQLSYQLLQLIALSLQSLHFRLSGIAGAIHMEPGLPRLHEVLQPGVIDCGVDALSAGYDRHDRLYYGPPTLDDGEVGPDEDASVRSL